MKNISAHSYRKKQYIFSNLGRVTFFALSIPNFMQSFRKNNKWSLRNLKTEGPKERQQSRAITKDLHTRGPIISRA